MSVEEFLGLPWKPRGRGRDGLDCWGLALLWAKERCGIVGPDFAYADPNGSEVPALFAADARRHASRVGTGAVKVNDLILLRPAGLPVHVGTVVAFGRMLHIMPDRTSVIEPYTGISWSHRIEGFWRWR